MSPVQYYERCTEKIKRDDTLLVETWSEGSDSGTVGKVVLMPADMLFTDQSLIKMASGLKLSVNKLS